MRTGHSNRPRGILTAGLWSFVLMVAAFAALMALWGSGGSAQAHSILYGAAYQGSNGPATLYTINTLTGAATPVGAIGFERCSGMDFNALGRLYATCERDGSNTHVLITINTATGQGTEVGPTGVSGLGFGGRMTDISFRNSDGVLYAYLGNNNGVGTVALTGAAVALGASNTSSCCGNGIAFSPGDTLYHATEGPLNTLNQVTGQATQVATLNYSPPADFGPRINGMDYEPDTGVLFASLNDGFAGSQENYLATVDTGTGNVTIIGQTQDGLDAIAFSVSVGGIVERIVDGSDSPARPAEGSGISGGGFAAIATGAAVAALTLLLGGWYARRRWLR